MGIHRYEKAANKAVGISRGARNTKIHTLVDGLGNPIAFMFSLSNENDSMRAVLLLKHIDIIGFNIPGDKTYGAQAINPSILKTFRCQSF